MKKIELEQEKFPNKVIRFTAKIPISSLEKDKSIIVELRNIFGEPPTGDDQNINDYNEKIVNWFREHYICNLIFDDAKQHYVKSLETTFNGKNIVEKWDWDTNGIFPGNYKVHVSVEPVITENRTGGMIYRAKESVKQKLRNVAKEDIAKELDSYELNKKLMQISDLLKSKLDKSEAYEKFNSLSMELQNNINILTDSISKTAFSDISEKISMVEDKLHEFKSLLGDKISKDELVAKLSAIENTVTEQVQSINSQLDNIRIRSITKPK